MKNLLFAVGLLSAFAAPLARAADCARAQVTGGDKCSNLTVHWDLAACPNAVQEGKSTVKCVGNDALATLRTADATYRVKVRGKKGSWDEVTWSAGEVSVEPHETKAVEKKVAKRATRPQLAASKQKAESPTVTKAKEETPPPSREVAATSQPIPAPDKAEPAKPLQFSGYLDGYYTYNFNRPAAGPIVNGLRADQNVYHPYNYAHDQFILNLAEIGVHRDAAPVGFRIDLGMGSEADHNAPNDLVTKYVSQAYVEITPTVLPRLTIDFGKMWTHMGLEVAHAQDNYNYSRSILYGFGIPVWHMGIRALYQVVPSKLVAGLYLYNGWSTSTFDNNTGKTYGGELNWTPSESLNVVYNVIVGPEANNDNSVVRSVNELNATYTVSPNVSVAADAIYGHDSGVGSWYAGELLGKVAVGSIYRLAPRLELYNDQDGITLGAGKQQVLSGTLTNIFDFGGGFESRLELRYDHSDQPAYSGARGNGLQDQITLSAAALYKF